MMQLIRLGYLVCAIYGLGTLFLFRGKERVLCLAFAVALMLIFYWLGTNLWELEGELDHSGIDF